MWDQEKKIYQALKNLMITMAVIAYCLLVYVLHIGFYLFKQNIILSKMWSDGEIKSFKFCSIFVGEWT